MTLPTTGDAKRDAARAAFYEWLSPKDRLIHDLAVKMLNTRYTPELSNAWVQWQKAAAAAK
jgi:hypothetical protein